ncbi:MAG: hypothetical protein RMM98_15115 [Acidobacteriota bacterium]|nr:hypothetical protein [Blastocatellia bacterium]MDW8240936.1 hypothetical protein [Acidobacteriota bacterium]
MTDQVVSDDTIHELRHIVRQYRVCYEVWPEWLMVGQTRRQVGFEVELCGVHQCQAAGESPPCRHGYQTYDQLKRIAQWLIAGSASTARCQILPYDAAVHQSPRRRFRPEVILTIKILHRHDHRFDAPVDHDEELCLKHLREKLAAIGIAEGIWIDPDKQRSAPPS